MSIDVNIRQVGLERKPLPLKVILGADLLYGAYDEGWRLHSGNRNDNNFVAYMPMQIARGIAVDWSEDETELIHLRALIPTAHAELRALYEIVYRVATYWQCEIEVDGRIIELEDFIDGFESMLIFNSDSLQKMAKSIIKGENSEMTLFSVMWPLVMGRAEAEAFVAEPTYFSKWLHEKQNVDAYYTKPAFYRSEEGILGRYAISGDMKCIVPIRPYVPYGFDDPETNELIVCENFGMLIYSVEKQETIGEMEYDDFIKALRSKLSKKIRRYDGNHIIVEELTESELKQLIE